MDTTAGPVDRTFDVLVVGGGNAGVSAAARLIRKGIADVALIEPQRVHTYRPLLSYVGGGQASMRDAERTQRSVTPRGCTWLQDSVVMIDASDRTVWCATGRRYRYRDLILGTGLVPDTGALPGIHTALDSPAVASNYLDRAEETWRLVQAMPRGGRAVFTVPRPPVSCTATTIKPLFLAAAHWKRTGRLPGVDITLVVDRPELLPAPRIDARLREHLRALDVRVLFDTAVTELSPGQSSITVTGRDGAGERLRYDMLHLVPPFRGARWLEGSGLTDAQPHGLIDIDPETFRHRTFPEVWAAGDAAAVETDPSGGALRRQISILVDNLLAARDGGQLQRYDGYTVAPVTTDAHRLIPGEYDRSGAVASSLPSFVDPLESRRTAWAFDRYVLPRTYWNLILKGRV
ncbi:pyridine nucleotide-disulfide oxidoreductase [Mycobacterium sp. IS-1496]|uniref:NAD(P)/FAD-dependent oxidoreductase n=1 Tax=Mycobacterium sp. IS-1496 TaxID=1772284 RepID=UPI00074163C5|nr:FAD/NAD(P)-binding oxidoreductase [Mycobacterium sp. IS-1496]KUI31524.1 pyridine nucleotide-disulfide oxidoreductase [Mycobacterium sp. IS-1496]